MVNFNGTLSDKTTLLSIHNRGYCYGDALFETIKTTQGTLLFWEDHYFRLMASMRIMRMDIPMNFTMEFLENEIQNTLKANNLHTTSARVKLMIHRNEGGLYLPTTNHVSFVISVKHIENDVYIFQEDAYEVDLFKDFYLSPSLLTTLKTNNKAINIVGSIYAKENNLDNCLLLNTEKSIVEAINGNIFVVKGTTIKTPPISDGCLKGIMRKQILELLKTMPEYDITETSISPFELQKADEIFITNVIIGVQPVTKYRKKEFKSDLAKSITQKLNEKLSLI